MAKLTGFPDEAYAAMQRIRDTALVRFNSLFTPERQLWSLENLQQFHALFVEHFDVGEGTFLEKWRKQLEGANDDIFQLAAELLYVQQLFTSVTGPEKKLENVKEVLGWCARPPVDSRVGNFRRTARFSRDQSFNQHRPFHLAWLNEFLIHWQRELRKRNRTGCLVIRGVLPKTSEWSSSPAEPINRCKRRGSISSSPTALKTFRREDTSGGFAMPFMIASKMDPVAT